ncbi:hypothetical protein NW762_010788 [Fusarium torreyae]|uniref:Uncharacterized protein n=1 Tax=Fusarium torreyae TaxID=1237075 RepID=A0A9W8RTR7_9HYPO|nr:hypothetical protein NW762_010788 [Fusarium torreyae]
MSDYQVEKSRDAPEGTPEHQGDLEHALKAKPALPAEDSPQPSTTILPPEHWQQADVDAPDNNDADSGLHESESSTASITSSILKYRTILGRTFHSEQGDAHYWGTNDDRQNEAMDIK